MKAVQHGTCALFFKLHGHTKRRLHFGVSSYSGLILVSPVFVGSRPVHTAYACALARLWM